MKTLGIYLWKEHIFQFMGYLLAFLAPIKWFIIVIEAFVFAELIFGRLVGQNDPTVKQLSFYRWLIKTILFLFTIQICRVGDIAFGLPISKIVAGYIVLHESQILNSYIKSYTGLDMMAGIEKIASEAYEKINSFIKPKE